MALSKIVVEKFCRSVCVHSWTGFFSKILKSTAKEDCSEHLCVANSTGRRNPNLHRTLAVLAAVQSYPFLKENQIYCLQHLWRKGWWLAITMCLSGNFLMAAFRIQQLWSWLPLFLAQMFSSPFSGYERHSLKGTVLMQVKHTDSVKIMVYDGLRWSTSCYTGKYLSPNTPEQGLIHDVDLSATSHSMCIILGE